VELTVSDNTEIPGQVSLDELGRGKPYILEPGHGEHTTANHSLRTLLARSQDTNGDVAILINTGDPAPPTIPHLHRHTTEAVLVLEGVVRVLLDDQKGTRIVKDLHEGEFGLLPVNWVHAWAFAAPMTRHLGVIAPGGFERVVNYLEPDKPPTIERLRESEKHIDVLWLPDYPLFGDFDDLELPKL
jgi:quercetin 2,3-dioxygenase